MSLYQFNEMSIRQFINSSIKRLTGPFALTPDGGTLGAGS